MPRNEKVNIILSAKDQTKGVLSSVKSDIIAVATAYGSWRIASDVIGDSIAKAAKFDATMVSLESVVNATGRDMNKVYAEMNKHLGGLASKANVASGFLKGMTTTLDVQQISNMTQAIKDASIAMGEDFNTQLPLIIKAVKQLNPAILDNIGVTVRLDEVNKRIRDGYYGAGTAINEFTQQNAIYQEIMKQTQQFQGQEAKYLETSAGKWQQLSVAVEDLQTTLGDLVVSGGLVNDFLAGVNDKLRDTVSILDQDGFSTWEKFVLLANQLMGRDLTVNAVINMKNDEVREATENLELLKEAMNFDDDFMATDQFDKLQQRLENLFYSLKEWRQIQADDTIAEDEFLAEEQFNVLSTNLNRQLEAWQTYEQMLTEAQIASISDREQRTVAEITYRYAQRKQQLQNLLNQNLISETQFANAVKALHSATNNEIAQATQKTHSQWSKETERAAGYIAGQFISLRGDLKSNWRDMANDFTKFFLNTILDYIAPGSGFIKSFISAFKFWDVAENDRAAINEGRRLMAFIQQGAMEQLARVDLAGHTTRNVSTYVGGVTVNVHGNVNDDNTIKKIEDRVINGITRLSLDKDMLTGTSSVRV